MERNTITGVVAAGLDGRVEQRIAVPAGASDRAKVPAAAEAPRVPGAGHGGQRAVVGAAEGTAGARSHHAPAEAGVSPAVGVIQALKNDDSELSDCV